MVEKKNPEITYVIFKTIEKSHGKGKKNIGG
jgi:hypothetical protein